MNYIQTENASCTGDLRLNLDEDPPIAPHSRDLGVLGFRV